MACSSSVYANVFLLQFDPLFGLQSDTLFVQMFLKPFNKLAASVLAGLKPLGFRVMLENPIKHSCLFVKQYLNRTAHALIDCEQSL